MKKWLKIASSLNLTALLAQINEFIPGNKWIIMLQILLQWLLPSALPEKMKRAAYKDDRTPNK